MKTLAMVTMMMMITRRMLTTLNDVTSLITTIVGNDAMTDISLNDALLMFRRQEATLGRIHGVSKRMDVLLHSSLEPVERISSTS